MLFRSILSDYDKGVVIPALLEAVLPRLRMMEVPVFVDPRPAHAASYHPLTVLTPNRKEAEEIVGFPVRTDNDLRKAAERLLEMTEGSAVLITRGDQGMALLERGARMRKIPTVARSEEHTSELQSHSEISYAVFCLKKKINGYPCN